MGNTESGTFSKTLGHALQAPPTRPLTSLVTSSLSSHIHRTPSSNPPSGCCGAESSGARRCLARCSVTNRRRQWHPTPGLLPGKSHGRKSLVGCSPGGCQELDTPERLHFHFSLSRIGEGNLQPTPVFLPGESQRRGSLVGCRLWGRTGSDTTEAT